METTPRPLPSQWMTLADATRTAHAHDLDTARDFETIRAPLDQLPDAEQARVALWAATHHGPMPTTVNLYRIRAAVHEAHLGLRQTSLDLATRPAA